MSLVEKLKSRDAVIGVIGLGYVGIPLALRFAEVGYSVVGFDIDEKRAETLNAGISPIERFSDASVAKALEPGFHAVTVFDKIRDVDAIVICVPTPLNAYREPDLSFVENTMETIGPYLRKEHHRALFAQRADLIAGKHDLSRNNRRNSGTVHS